MSTYIRILALCSLGLATAAPLGAQVPEGLPVAVDDAVWSPLRANRDAQLQDALESRVRTNRFLSGLVDKKLLALAVVDLANPEAPRFANLNGTHMMYAASLPKIAILLAAMQQMEDGTLVESDEVMHDLNAMIRTSSNGAATRMIERVGGLNAIEKVLTDPRYELFDPEFGGGLWVGKAYAKSGTRNPDPLQGLSHAATANQVSRFYYLVAEGRLVSEERSRQMLEILSSPGINHKFVNSLSRIAPEAEIFRKSGSWRNWHSDSALVWGPEWRRYIVVCLVEHKDGEQIIRDIIPLVEDVLGPEAN